MHLQWWSSNPLLKAKYNIIPQINRELASIDYYGVVLDSTHMFAELYFYYYKRWDYDYSGIRNLLDKVLVFLPLSS
jgi:hypothetical protein